MSIDAPRLRPARVFAVLNPAAGTCTAEDVRQALGRYFPCDDGTCQVYELTGREAASDVVREAVGRGVDLVVAAGGDGTVSAVANGIVPGTVPLGILPVGTANVLARDLGIPLDLEAACRLLAGALPNTTTGLDAMQVDGRVYFTQVGVGIDSLMIRDTPPEQKRRFGRVAYLWTGLRWLVGAQPRRFSITVDGRGYRPRASQVVVANSGVLGQPPFQWGPGIRPDDGKLDVCVIRARTAITYAGLAWHVVLGRHDRSAVASYFQAEQAIAIHADRPLPVQGDGEIIGQTPVQVQVIPHAVRVIVPAQDGESPPA